MSDQKNLLENDASSDTNLVADYSPLTQRAIDSGISPNTVREATGDINIKRTELQLSPFGRYKKEPNTRGRSRSFTERAFSKLEKGSLRGSIMNLCNAAIGGGVLSLPFVFVLNGWVIGTAMMIIGLVAGVWSNLMIAKMAINKNLGNLDNIARAAGGKAMQNLLSVMTLIFMGGVCTGLQIILAQLIAYVVVTLGVDADFASTMLFRAYVGIPSAIFIFLPLALLRDMSSLSYASFAALLSLLYTGILLIVEAPFYWNENINKPDTVVLWWKFDLNIFSAFSITFFSFTCQLQLLPIYSELVKPNYRRIKKVIVRAMFIDFLFYMVMAGAGYASTFNFTNSIVLMRPALPNMDPDYFMMVAASSVSIVMFASLPVNYNPWRNQFFLLCYGTTEFSNRANVICTSVFMACTCAGAIVFPDISKLLSVLGGLCSVTLCYTIPTYSWVKLSDHKWTHPENLVPIIFFGILILTGYVSVFLTLYELFAGVDYIGDRPDIRGS